MGRYIREKRRPHLSLRSFAKQLGVSASYLSDIERGNRKISKDMVFRIVCALGRTVGGNTHEHYDLMLMHTGHLTAERECLTRLWKACKARSANPLFRRLEEQAYEALYGELDMAFYGFPRETPPAVADAVPYEEVAVE